MKSKKLSSPFTIQMTSGNLGDNCRWFCQGSIQTVQQEENGQLWIADREVDPIPINYPYKLVNVNIDELNHCITCSTGFPKDWPLINGHCTSCYAANNIFGPHNLYKDAIRKEYEIELQTLKK